MSILFAHHLCVACSQGINNFDLTKSKLECLISIQKAVDKKHEFFCEPFEPYNWTVPAPSKCPGIVTKTILTVLIAVVGIVGNGLVICFTRSDLKQRKSPDKLLLLHKSIVNLLGCCVSLPIFYFDSSEILKSLDMNVNLASSICLLGIFAQFFCLRSGHFMLAVLCFERFELITKGPQVKWLTYERTRRIIFAIYGLVFVVMTAVMSGFIVHLTAGDQQNLLCLFDGSIDPSQQTFGPSFSITGLIAESVISLTLVIIICATTLKKTDKYVKEHIESVRATLGDQSTIKEVRLLRNARAFNMAYIIVWVPFGIARAAKSIYPDSVDVECFYTVTYILSYSVFSSIPVLYLIMDKRIKVPFLRSNDVIGQGNSPETAQQN